MRLSLRFIIPLLLALAGLAYAVRPLVDSLVERWFVRDLDIRASLIANTVQEPLRELARTGKRPEVVGFFNGITMDERLYAIGLCRSTEDRVVATATFPSDIHCNDLKALSGPVGHPVASANGPLLVSVRPFKLDSVRTAELVLVHDMSFVARRSEETGKYLFFFFLILGATVSLITVVVAQLSWRGWVQGMRALLRGEGLLRAPGKPDAVELRPIAHDLRALVRELQTEHRPRGEDQLAWSAESLRTILRSELRGQEVFVVSNREPYIHDHVNDTIAVRRPASGLVTAMEPIMRACAGVWIAHGSGSADRESVDRHDRIAVPPGAPAYQLRRVWLSPEEERGYYYGFSNEGLWPLCHIAHVRPIFRSSDWEQYVKVNERFARTVVDEATSADPIVLVQDYHLALVPRMIREVLPSATIIAFWHIPWPNPEAFSICPWRNELLDGLLGSTILGFQTQSHCNNFVDTVDRLLEARSDREAFDVSYRGQLTAVKRYPISIEWPVPEELTAKPIDRVRLDVRQHLDLPPKHAIGIGVDRLDYTKGIEERFRAVERLMELHPHWIGRFSFVQIAAPTRGSIEQYLAYEMRVRSLAARINDRFAGAAHPPIILKVEHHEAKDLYDYYRAADVCLVSSLHDGMNLVAKEFVASRDDDGGVLILSQFAGAARELPEAIVVNPYDADQCADALHMALSMPRGEQRARMRLMRGLIREFNVYRWAGRMLLDAAATRQRRRLLRRLGESAPWAEPVTMHETGPFA
ncbi:MAG: trehalose-6-phosphate synthase [bacterium]